MKAFNKSHPALAGQAGLILLFDGEVGRSVGQASRLSFRLENDEKKDWQHALPARNHDEHNQTDILTWGLNLAPAFPIPFGGTSGCGSL